jgi:8-oxo-dGTP pyrophosphatase MutT (NUDIX family)
VTRRPLKQLGMQERRELSAGGVVYRRSGESAEVALIRTGKRWGLPKGHVEAGEGIQQAACREVLEETGLEGDVVGELGEISYHYAYKKAGGELVRVFKRVHFFLLHWTKGEIRGHDYEVDEARWFGLEEALEKLTYPTEQKMVRQAMAMIEKSKEPRAKS